MQDHRPASTRRSAASCRTSLNHRRSSTCSQRRQPDGSPSDWGAQKRLMVVSCIPGPVPLYLATPTRPCPLVRQHEAAQWSPCCLGLHQLRRQARRGLSSQEVPTELLHPSLNGQQSLPGQYLLWSVHRSKRQIISLLLLKHGSVRARSCGRTPGTRRRNLLYRFAISLHILRPPPLRLWPLAPTLLLLDGAARLLAPLPSLRLFVPHRPRRLPGSRWAQHRQRLQAL